MSKLTIAEPPNCTRVSAGRMDVVLVFPTGRIRLCGKLPEERAEYLHRLHPLHVHLRCHCRAAFQGQVLLLHRRVKRPGEGLQVESLTTALNSLLSRLQLPL